MSNLGYYNNKGNFMVNTVQLWSVRHLEITIGLMQQLFKLKSDSADGSITLHTTS
jgi:hypothetical protein